MAITTSSTTNFSDLVHDAVQAQVEQNLRAMLAFMTPENWLPAVHETGTRNFRVAAYSDLTQDLTSDAIADEGTPPDPVTMAVDSTLLTGTQYAKRIQITDMLQYQNPENLVQQATLKVARWLEESLNAKAKEALEAASKIYINGSTESAVSAKVVGTDILKMAGRFAAGNIPRFSDGYWRAVVSPRVGYDLKSDTAGSGWIEAVKYGDSMRLFNGEIGTFGGFRFIESTIVTTNATAGAGGVDVVTSYFYGPESIGVGDLATLETYVTPPGGHGDELHQKCDIAGKCFLASGILKKNGEKCRRLLSAATILDNSTDH